MNKILLIIDAQNDFINGSLAVKDAEEKMLKLADYFNEHKDEYKKVIFTCDWHPSNHVSFNDWPPHCIQHTQGAAIYDTLIKSVIDSKIPYNVLTKGDSKYFEEYSIVKNYISKRKLYNIIVNENIDEVDVCGIANEYCVNDSVKDLYNEKWFKAKVNVLINYVAAINDDSVLINTCNELNINIIK